MHCIPDFWADHPTGSKNYLLNVHVVSSSTTMLYQQCWADFPSGILITSFPRFADNLFIDKISQIVQPKGQR